MGGAPIPSSGRPSFPRSFGRSGGNFRGGGGQFSRQSGSKRVFVSNLAWDVSWQDLKDYFREVGNVLHSDVLHGPDGKSKGCGIVEFDRAETAREAIESRNNTTLKGRMIYVREDRQIIVSGLDESVGWQD